MLMAFPIGKWVKRSVPDGTLGNHHSGSPGPDCGIPKRLYGISRCAHQVIVLPDNLSVFSVIDSVFLEPILEMIEDFQPSGLEPCDHGHDARFYGYAPFGVQEMGSKKVNPGSSVLIG
jgi:hypothetical protein